MIDEHPEMTTKQWVMEGLARAFGVCVTLREDAFNLSEKQITEKIREHGQHEIQYHQKELANADIENLRKRTEAEWRTAWLENEKAKQKSNQDSIIRKEKVRLRHTQVGTELRRILESPKAHQFTKDVAKFGLDQLDVASSDCEPYIQESETLTQFKLNTFKHNEWNINYHKEELAKAEERTRERIKLYLQLRKDLDKVLTEAGK